MLTEDGHLPMGANPSVWAASISTIDARTSAILRVVSMLLIEANEDLRGRHLNSRRGRETKRDLRMKK